MDPTGIKGTHLLREWHMLRSKLDFRLSIVLINCSEMWSELESITWHISFQTKHTAYCAIHLNKLTQLKPVVLSLQPVLCATNESL